MALREKAALNFFPIDSSRNAPQPCTGVHVKNKKKRISSSVLQLFEKNVNGNKMLYVKLKDISTRLIQHQE
jgi:Ser-tRNA(Ala) deacylase AlaX